MQKIFSILCIPAALLLCLFSFSSCSDDDDIGEARETEQGGMQADDMEAFVLLNRFCGLSELPSDWKSKTYEPIYGSVINEAEPFVRYQPVFDFEEARLIFEGLTGEDADSNSVTTVSRGGAELNFTPVRSNTLFATLDIAMKQMPSLTRVCFVPKSVIGDNDYPYYSVGDVIKASDGCYWVCIDPGTVKSKNSQWCSLQLTTKNFYHTNSEYLPMVLGTDLAQAKKMLELMATLYYAEEGCLSDDFQSQLFGTLSLSEIKKIAAWWEVTGAFDKILPKGIQDIKCFFDQLLSEQYFHVFYYGHTGRCPYHSVASFSFLTDNNKIRSIYVDGDPYKWKSDASYYNLKSSKFDMKPYAHNCTKGTDTQYNTGYCTNGVIVRSASGETLFNIAGSKKNYSYESSKINPYGEVYCRNDFENFYRRAESGSSALGEVIVDQNGDRWFCVLPAGQKALGNETNMSYYISFDSVGITTKKESVILDNQYVYNGYYSLNIAPMDVCPKILLALARLYYMNRYGSDSYAFENNILQFIRLNAGVDIRDLFMESEYNGMSYLTTNVVCASRGSQNHNPMLRMAIGMNQASMRAGQAYFYNLYYDGTADDNHRMSLYDIASAGRVGWFSGIDMAPYYSYFWPSAMSYIERGQRISADVNAMDIRNYYYQKNLYGRYADTSMAYLNNYYRNRSWSMFNDPVLVFRVAVFPEHQDGAGYNQYLSVDGSVYKAQVITHNYFDTFFSYSDLYQNIYNYIYHTDDMYYAGTTMKYWALPEFPFEFDKHN